MYVSNMITSLKTKEEQISTKLSPTPFLHRALHSKTMKFTYHGAGGGAMRSMSENSRAARTARINIVVCFTNCLWKEIQIYLYRQ